MWLPLDLDSFAMWLAATSIILLIASEAISPNYSGAQLFIDKRKLRRVASLLAIAFLVAVGLRVLSLLSL
jgi:hypothetical protein